MHTHSLIIRAVAAMDRCFALIGAHQHGIAVGSMNGESPCFKDPLLPRRVQSTGQAQLIALVFISYILHALSRLE